MNTAFEMVALVALTVLYALAWHNQPARQEITERRANRR